MHVLTSLRDSAGEVWSALSTGHRIILVLLAVLTIGAVAGILFWASGTRYRVLGAHLQTKKAAKLVKKLGNAGISAHLAEGGGGVMVPREKMSKARVLAAREGITPRTNEAFKIFESPKLGMTPFAQKVNYTEALQTDLEGTIKSMHPVSFARVHLVVPEDRVFASREKSATASVLVRTKRGSQLSSSQVAGIANLVSSAVEQLDPSDVTVTDGRGTVLRGNETGSARATAADQLQYRRRMEEHLAQKAESMLARTLGHDNCEVRVSADLEFQDRTETTKTYDPDNRVVKEETVENSTSTRSNTRVGGPVGAGAQSEAEDRESSSPENSTIKEEETVETTYLVSKTSKETVEKGAKVKRLGIAAFIDSQSSGEGKAESSGPSREKLENVIKSALGFEKSRGDTLSIVKTDLQESEPPVTHRGQTTTLDRVLRLAPYGALAAAGIALLVLARRLIAGISEDTTALPGPAADGPPLSPEERTRPQLMWQRVCQHASEEPRSAGRLLEAWILEEE